MSYKEHNYRVLKLLSITDGDTFHLFLDKGHWHQAGIPIRLLGHDCPEETKGSAFERRKAREAEQFSRDYFAREGVTFWVHTEPDKAMTLGRWLGDPWYELPDGTEVHLSTLLVYAGLAVVSHPTRGPKWYQVYDPQRNLP